MIYRSHTLKNGLVFWPILYFTFHITVAHWCVHFGALENVDFSLLQHNNYYHFYDTVTALVLTVSNIFNLVCVYLCSFCFYVIYPTLACFITADYRSQAARPRSAGLLFYLCVFDTQTIISRQPKDVPSKVYHKGCFGAKCAKWNFEHLIANIQ